MEYKYPLLGVGIGLMMLAALYALSTLTSADGGVELNNNGSIAQTSGNDQYFQQQAQDSGGVCGDLTSNANIQHLSHHPDRYEDCLMQVDPALLKQATGKTLNEILGN